MSHVRSHHTPSTPRRRRLAPVAALASTALASTALVASTLLIASAPAHAAQVTLTENDVNLSYTRLQGSHEFLADGVRVTTVGTTSQSKAAGYVDVDLALAETGEPTLDHVADSGPAPGMQLVVDLDGDGTEDGTLVGEPAVYGDDWWLPASTLDGVAVDPALRAQAPKEGGGGSADNGSLDQWRAAFPDAQVTRFGWSLGSGVQGSGIIFGMSIAEDDYYFTAAERTTETVYRSDISQRDTRTQGRNQFRPVGGVRIQTFDNSGQAKVTGYFGVDTALALVGEPTWDHRATEGIEPGKQLVIDLDGDDATVGDRGILVGEPVYGADWWLTGGSAQVIRDRAPVVGGGSGSQYHGSLNQWRLAMPDAVVLEAGWSLGSGVLGDGVLTEMTLGTTTYEIGANRAPSAADVSGSLREGDEPIVIDLAGTDPDTDVFVDYLGLPAVADTLTYTVDGAEGDVSVDGDQLTYAADDVDADVTDELTYTVTDDRGLSATADVTVEVTANGAPTANDRTLRGRLGSTLEGRLFSTDPEGDPVTVTVGDTTGGTVTLDGRRFAFTPNAGFVGEASFDYVATDDRGASTEGTITVVVRKALADVEADVLTRADGRSFVVGEVGSRGGNPNLPRGTFLSVTRAGLQVGSGRVVGGDLVDAQLPARRPGILIGRDLPQRGFVVLSYPGTATVAAATVRVPVVAAR